MVNLVMSQLMISKEKITRFWLKNYDSCKKFVTRGGVKITVGRKTAVLTLFVILVVGDTAGHNDLCGHFQKDVSMPVLPLWVKTAGNV